MSKIRLSRFIRQFRPVRWRLILQLITVLLLTFLTILAAVLVFRPASRPQCISTSVVDALNRIDKTLQDQLSASDHEGIIEAIRSLNMSPPVNRPSPKLDTIFLILSFVGLLIGILLLVHGVRTRSPLALTLGTLLSLGGLSLFPIKELALLKFYYQHPSHMTVVQESLECAKLGEYGPFTTGKAEISGQLRQSELEELVSAIRTKPSSHKLEVLMLVGRADRRQLLAPLARAFGSNAGLAQARARFVQSLLAPYLVDRPLVLTLNSGPTMVSGDESEIELSRDRCVEVFAFWSRSDTSVVSVQTFNDSSPTTP